MSKPSLSVSLINDSLTSPVIHGDVTLRDFSFQVISATSVDKNSRQMLARAFDVAEMSLATFVRAYADGAPLIGIPAFTGRRFIQPAICCGPRANIRHIEDLDGKRVVVPQYWLTSSVWHRGILKEFHGIPQDRINWVTTADERLGTLPPPKGVNVHRAPDGMSPLELLKEGAVDCMLLPKVPANASDWVSPFSDLNAAQSEYYRRSRVFPIMHMVVVSTDAVARYPDLPQALMDLFARAKSLAKPQQFFSFESGKESSNFDGEDLWTYGVEPNRRALETFLGYALEQGLIDRPVHPKELFAGVD